MGLFTYLFGTTVFNRTYGGIHLHDGSTAQSIATGTGYTKLTGFANDSLSNDCTPDYANDQITITRAGNYRLCFSTSFTCGTNNVTWKIAAFKDTTEIDTVHAQSKLAIAGDSQNISCCEFAALTAGQNVSLRARHDQAGSINFTPIYMTLILERIGD